METLLAPLRDMEEFTQLKTALEQGESPLEVVGGMDAQKAHMIYGLRQAKGVNLIVTYNEIRAKELLEDMAMYDRQAMYYPAKDLIFYSADVHGQAIAKERLKVVKALSEQKNLTVITTIDAGMDHCFSFEKYEKQKIEITPDKEFDLEQLQKQLSAMGYEKAAQVEQEGEFSVRGGIVDIFPLTEESPVRIEFWDTQVDTIRSIDVQSQRSVEELEEVVIFPAGEIFLSEDEAAAGLHQIGKDMEKNCRELKEQGKREEAARLRQNVENFRETFQAYHGMVNLESYIGYFARETVSFFDYFKGKNVCVFLDEPNRCRERAQAVEYEFRESMTSRLEKGYILPGQMEVLYDTSAVYAKLGGYPLVLMTALDTPMKEMVVDRKFFLQVQSSPSYNNKFCPAGKRPGSLPEKEIQGAFGIGIRDQRTQTVSGSAGIRSSCVL